MTSSPIRSSTAALRGIRADLARNMGHSVISYSIICMRAEEQDDFMLSKPAFGVFILLSECDKRSHDNTTTTTARETDIVTRTSWLILYCLVYSSSSGRAGLT